MPESVSRLATDIGGDLLRGALLGTPLPLLDGRYRVDRILGRGATGVVVRARDERLARDVAIKVAPSSAASQRMLQEARALARMRRPAFVVQVWETASGRFSEASFVGLVNYIVMELVIGVTLRVWGAATQPGARDVLAVYAKVATGLANVHAAGLAHGDVKPDNIILDASGAPTLVDFGFAAPTQQARRGGQRGEVVGTPAYMAPEVLTGDVLPASDVYAFATSLSEALTGSLPVDGDLVDCSPRGPSGHLGEWLLPRPLREALT
ncbi:MAG: serine/threonine protein kinase, partial [Myxococcales bacterium]|nr:serine/threonine protein kinase [Myxococcales bacterium]